MSRINIPLSPETELGLLEIKVFASKNNIPAKSKTAQIELAVKWANDFLEKLETKRINTVLGIKK